MFMPPFPDYPCTCPRCPHCGGRLPGPLYRMYPYPITVYPTWHADPNSTVMGYLTQTNGANNPEPQKSAFLTGLSIAKGQ